MELPFNPLGDNSGGPIPPVDPADLRRVRGEFLQGR